MYENTGWEAGQTIDQKQNTALREDSQRQQSQQKDGSRT